MVIKKNGDLLWYDPVKAHTSASISNKIGYSKISKNESLKKYGRLKQQKKHKYPSLLCIRHHSIPSSKYY